MKTRSILIIVAVLLAGCKNKADKADAFGNFEATEVIVSAETNGRIMQLDPVEGTQLNAGAKIALIDTTLVHLQKAEIDAGMKSIKTRISSINAQNDIMNQQIVNLNININRIGKMLKEDAATQKQMDDLTGQVAVLQKQIAANNTQKESVAAELIVSNAKKMTLGEQVRRSTILSPLNGTVLEKYAEAGEITIAG